MADQYIIPMSEGAQSFTVQLGGERFRLTAIYRDNSRGGAWYIDFEKSDKSDGIYGIPLVLGTDLLGQYPHKGFGHLWIEKSDGTMTRPNYADMGTAVNVVWSAENATVA